MEEITISEELTQPKPWKLWCKENGKFLCTMSLLLIISIILLIQNIIDLNQTHSIELPTLPLQPAKTTSSSPSRILGHKKKNPLSMAYDLYRKGETQKAIQYLLHLAQTTSDEALKEKSEQLAKKIHLSVKQREKNREIYLQGYILFATYPEMACQKWKSIIATADTEDSYYQKSLHRWKTQCSTTP